MTLARHVVSGSFAVCFSLAALNAGAERVVGGQLLWYPLPDYKIEWRNAGLTGKVAVSTTVGLDGTPDGVRLLSEPSAFDDAVTEAVKLWLFIPTVCVYTPAPSTYEARFDVAFEREADRYFISIRNLRYTGPGAPDDPPLKRPPPAKRVGGDELRFPRKAIEAHLSQALVLAVLNIKRDGTVDVAQVFSAPKKFFADEVRSTLEGWRFEPVLDEEGRPKEALACVPIHFKMDYLN